MDFEKLGLFYLGKTVPSSESEKGDPLLYDSKNLTTHAVCLGMTGSGKTGLGIAILEEAGIDHIPAIIIDPKGDLGNLLLTFPHLSPEEFLPWIDQSEAERKGMDPLTYAASVAKTWQEGLAKWGEGADRIQKLRNSVNMVIYTPASQAGIPLSVLSSFAAPPEELLKNPEALRDKVLSLASSLLGLIGIDADPIKSREHVLLSLIIDQAWRQKTNLDIAAIIHAIQNPPFAQVGALDTDTFFPSKERLEFSIKLNQLLASPGFQAWMEGEPLDIQNLLYTPEGTPKLSILSIAHLSDQQRMFFVTLVLNEILAWARLQPGTSSLRALLYMDEIFGFFPPTAMPPSKTPMLTLLKQARAYGLGIVLATQNPVDLDYKGLSNCGTWFIGKLQTERDKARVIEGLKIASSGESQTTQIDRMLANTGKRTFIMRSVYEKEPILFQTRWTLSYLRGPLTLTQISELTPKAPSSVQEDAQVKQTTATLKSKPLVSSDIPEYFLNSASTSPAQYHPYLLGIANLHFVDVKHKINFWKKAYILSPIDHAKAFDWEKGTNRPDIEPKLEKAPKPNRSFDPLPAALTLKKNYLKLEKDLASYAYQGQSIELYSHLKMTSEQDESKGDFLIRLTIAAREQRDALVAKLREKYDKKITTLTDKLRRLQEKISEAQSQASLKKTDTIISAGATILGTIFGKGVTKGTLSQAGSTLKQAGRLGKQSQSVQKAQNDYNACRSQLDALETQLKNETATIPFPDPNQFTIETITITPRKSDISIESISLVWSETAFE